MRWDSTASSARTSAIDRADGSSIKKSFTPEVTAKKLEAYLSELDSRDESRETPRLDIPKSQMPAKLRELKERVRSTGSTGSGSSRGETQILETDAERRTLYSKDGLHPAYNVQTVADTKSRFITNFEMARTN